NQGDVNHVTGDIHFATILLKKRNTLLTIHDCGMLSDSTGLKHQLLKLFWITLPLKKCALITVVSEATSLELRRYTSYPAEKIFVVPVAVSPEFLPMAKIFNKVKPEILLVGTTQNKNVLRLIEAVKNLVCKLNIVGRLTEEMSTRLNEYKIEFTNAYDLTAHELIQQYEKCDMLAFVSTYEGFGMPIVEANAVGRPVITSNILSMPDVAGNAALLVNPLQVGEITAGIRKIIDDDSYRDSLVKNGLENCKRFDPQIIAGQYLKLYENLYAGKYA
ncbi:MAG: glycosyltransferase family 1 protein, partial [Chitinophagaceae bacterium]